MVKVLLFHSSYLFLCIYFCSYSPIIKFLFSFAFNDSFFVLSKTSDYNRTLHVAVLSKDCENFRLLLLLLSKIFTRTLKE